MKAVILAGGRGTRGRPYTNYFPKAMIPVEGRPLIAHLSDYLASSHKIDEIIVLADLEGLGGQIRNYLPDSIGGKQVSFVQDSGDGTGGDLLHLRPRLKGEREFILWFSDNLCGIDISGMMERFAQKKSMACIATRSKRREETGFAVVKDGLITQFREKPEVRLPMAECLGIYVLSTGILAEIRRRGPGPVNLSYDVLEALSQRGLVSAFDIGATPWMDAESPVAVERNGALAKRITRQMGRRSAAQTRI